MLARTRLKPLADQTIVITGASSGIGLATARLAAERGARVLLVARNGEALAALAEEIRMDGGAADFVPADVSKPEDVARVVAVAVERFGGFDTWVNGAALALYGFLDEIDPEDHRRLFETNYWGVVTGTLAAVEHLRPKGGAVITIGSVLSEVAVPLQGPYVASKHAVKGFVDSLRQDLDAERVPVSLTLIKPTSIDTPYVDHAKTLFNRQPKTPGPRYSPRIVARAILDCAVHPRREMTVGGGGKAMVVLARTFPGLFDTVMARTYERGQMRDAAVGDGDEATRDNLDGPRRDGAERGAAGLSARETSLYTEVRLRPGAAILLAGAAIGVGVLVASRVSTGRWPWEQPPRGWRRLFAAPPALPFVDRLEDRLAGAGGRARRAFGSAAGEAEQRLGHAAAGVGAAAAGLGTRFGATAADAGRRLGRLGGRVESEADALYERAERLLGRAERDAVRLGDRAGRRAEDLYDRAAGLMPSWRRRRPFSWTDPTTWKDAF